MIGKRFSNNNKSAIKLNQFQKNEIELIKKKISTGEYEFIKISCPICGEKTNFETLSEKDRYGFNSPLQICKTCGLVLSNPRLREEDYDDFYTNGHQKRIYVGTDQPKIDYFKTQRRKGKNIYNFIFSKIETNRKLRILEVGCGAGGILHVFKVNGHEIKGIDLNPTYIDYGRTTYNLNLSTQNLFDIKKESYDLIIYSHVLEHIIDLNAHLSFIKKLLDKDGKLYVEVPGIKKSYIQYGDFLRYIQNAHVYNFSLTSLTNLMTLNNYSMVSKGNENIESIWESSDKNGDEIINDYENCKKYLKRNNRFIIRLLHHTKKDILSLYVSSKRKILNLQH